MHPPAALFEQLVSKPRLDSYRNYWKATPDEAVGIYMWNAEVCSELGKLLCHFEIALRNGIHRELSLNASPGGSASMAWWDTHWGNLSLATQNAIQTERTSAGRALGPDEIVSRLSFGFWPNALRWTAKNRARLLAPMFPGHPLTLSPGPGWADRQLRTDALDEIFEIKEVRNRVAHHEPLWKFPNVVDTSRRKPWVKVPGSTNEVSTLARFARLLAIFDKVFMSLTPAMAGYLRACSARQRLDYLLTAQGIQRYREGCHIPAVQELGTMALHQQFAGIVRANRPVRISDAGGSGVFIPTY